MSPRPHVTFALVASTLLVAGCGASTSANSPSASAPASATPTPVSCVAGAKYCQTFAGTKTGWPEQNASESFQGRDPYLGGSYRMVQRANSTSTATAPIDASDVSQDYSVQVDVDAFIAKDSVATGELGIVCWEHPVKDDTSGTQSAFLFFVGRDSAKIVLWDDLDGSAHTITTGPTITGLLKTDAPNHLTAQCVQGSSSGGAVAQLALTVNGTKAVAANYELSVRSWDWSVVEKNSSGAEVSKLGVLASGKGEDVFYQAFAVTSKCQPGGDIPCPTS